MLKLVGSGLLSANSGNNSGWYMNGGGTGKRLLGISIGIMWILVRFVLEYLSFVNAS